MSKPLAAVILAAGKGTRMKSDLHKVLHPIAGRAMIEHLLDSVEALGAERVVVVVGDRREQLEKALAGRGVDFAVQEPQLGTAHAVLQAEAALAGFDGDVLLLSGDVPFIRTATMRAMLDALHGDSAPACVVLGFRPREPGAYGRILAGPDRKIVKMVEHKDASEEERAVGLCNANLFALRAADLWQLLKRVGNDNAQKEYYLPDIVMVAAADGRSSLVVEGDSGEAIGPNSRAEFALAEAAWQTARRAEAMAEGVTLIAPETVWFAWDTKLGRDVLIEPNVVFEPGVEVGQEARIEAHLIIPEGSKIPPGAIVSSANRFSFQRWGAHRSTAWTGRFSTSERARMIVDFGPVVIDSLGAMIRDLELRAHNSPPALVNEQENEEQLLSDLKKLRIRINELIHALERGEESAGQLEEIGEFYRARIEPWLKARFSEAAGSVASMLSLSPALVLAYLTLSQLFDNNAFVAFMGGAISGILSGGLQGRRASEKD